jgi:protein O-mannosyl-transferase
MSHRERKIAFFGLAIIVWGGVLAAYLPGLAGVIHFDDRFNLDGLYGVTDGASAFAFVFSGSAGPTGRPLSLLTFLPHAHAWPDNLRPFFATNIAIHLLNGALVGVLAWLVARQSPSFSTPNRAPWAALAVAAIWLALPLLASSSLFVVQRMTTLAALLVLLGLCLHMAGRAQLMSRPVRGIGLMTAGLFVGLGLGLLAKETAALYPLLVLALDRTILARMPKSDTYRIWRMPMIMAPALLLLIYMLYRLIQGGGYDQRHFDLTERLLTQGVALFDYLRLMLLPLGRDLGPFHDHYPIYGGYPAALAVIATLAWVAGALFAFHYGPRRPFVAFAVLWFLAAHLIESSWIPLELYYEHRNYLPAVGVVIALVLGLGQLRGRAGHMVYGGFALYAAVLTFSLLQVTALWGNPRVAAELWWDRNPGSVRATQFLADYHTREGFPLIAARILDGTAAKDPSQLFLPLQSMRLNCVAGENERALEMFSSILERAPDARYVNRSADTDAKALEAVLLDIVSGKCQALEYSDIVALASAYLEGRATRAKPNTIYNFYVLKSRASGHEGDLESMMGYLVTGLEHHISVEAAKMAALMAEEQGRLDFLQRVHGAISASVEPRNPVKRAEWRVAVSEIEDRLGRLSASPISSAAELH